MPLTRTGVRPTGEGTIRFPPDAPLPDALVRQLVEARIAENAASLRTAR